MTYRYAYTLDGKQPVVCNLIGDKPLFYMEFNHSDADFHDDFFDDDELHTLEQEITTLKREIEAEEKLCLPDIHHEFKLEDFRNNFKDQEELCLISLSQAIQSSRFISMMGNGMRVELNPQVKDVEVVGRIIYLWPYHDLETAYLLVAREIRRYYRKSINPLNFEPDHAVLINRVNSADLAITMARAAWEAQLLGWKECWYRCYEAFPEVSRAYLREASTDWRSINNGNALRSAFETYFMDCETINRDDKDLIRRMLASNEYIWMSEVRSLSVQDLAQISQLPFGETSYLRNYLNVVMSDPIFTEVRKRENANFLWFIKFESSFRKTEDELHRKTRNEVYEDAWGEPKLGEVIHIDPNTLLARKQRVSKSLVPARVIPLDKRRYQPSFAVTGSLTTYHPLYMQDPEDDGPRAA